MFNLSKMIKVQCMCVWLQYDITVLSAVKRKTNQSLTCNGDKIWFIFFYSRQLRWPFELVNIPVFRPNKAYFTLILCHYNGFRNIKMHVKKRKSLYSSFLKKTLKDQNIYFSVFSNIYYYRLNGQKTPKIIIQPCFLFILKSETWQVLKMYVLKMHLFKNIAWQFYLNPHRPWCNFRLKLSLVLTKGCQRW